MNLSVKRCLLGLVASAAMFGNVRAQDDESVGTVQLGQKPQVPVQQLQATQVPVTEGPGIYSLQPIPGSAPSPSSGYGVAPNSPGGGSSLGFDRIDPWMMPRFIVDSRGGSLYGYNAGYSNVGAFVPYKLDDTAILFVTAQGLITYDSRGGATLGTGWRYYMEDLDRIVGLAGFYDFDNGHEKPYQQLGLSFESLGRYVDYRMNGYIPVSSPDHVLFTGLTGTSQLLGTGIGLMRNNTVEQAFSGFDAEMGGPTPILGRYGLNAYIGAYYFGGMGANGGNFTGVSGRLLSQINEDVQFGVQVTNDHMFGLNTQFQVFVNVPNGKPGRWMRNLSVKDRMTQNVFRQNRVIAETERFVTFDAAIDPNSHKPYFVANIDPNKTTNGDGSVENPFHSVAEYEALSQAQRERYNIVLVRPRNDGTSTNLDTASTLFVYNNQRLLSTTVQQTFTTENLPGVDMILGGFTGGSNPILFNSSGGDVVTLVGGNTQIQQVSGFNIQGSSTGNGIRGDNNTAVVLGNNEISGGLNGVLLTNLSGTISAGTYAQIFSNNVHNNVGNGIQITNLGSPPALGALDVVVQGNTFKSNGIDGLQMNANGGSTIGGVIGGQNTATTTLANTFDSNTRNGLNLTANGGTLVFMNNGFGIVNNTFTSNGNNGLNMSTTNNSIATFDIQQNVFGSASSALLGNKKYGLALSTDSGSTLINVGGATAAQGNLFYSNQVNAIDFALTGTAAVTYNIQNNIINNMLNNTAGSNPLYADNSDPQVDAFLFAFSGLSGSSPFTLLNESSTNSQYFAPATIKSLSWDLATGSTGLFAPTSAGNPVIVQPSDGDTLLTSVNNVNVTPGSSPLNLLSNNALLANNANLGLAPYGTKLLLGFNNGNFNTLPGTQFEATSLMMNRAGQVQDFTNTVGSTVQVTFSDGRVATAQLALDPADSTRAIAEATVLGSLTPGHGAYNDGIHIASSGSAITNPSAITQNTITGVGGYGINVETNGSSKTPNLHIENNIVQNNGTGARVNSITNSTTSVFTGGGIRLSENGDANAELSVYLANNTINKNFNYGVDVFAGGAGKLTLNSVNNNLENDSTDDQVSNGNANAAFHFATAGTATLVVNSVGDKTNGSGIGATLNPDVYGGDNIVATSGGASTANYTFHGLVSNNANGSALTAISNGTSTLNLLVDQGSSFQMNGQNGIHIVSNDQSLAHVTIEDTTTSMNVQNGISFERNNASLILANITNTVMNSNSQNGLFFQSIGSDPYDPLQPNSGQASVVNLTNSSLDNNTGDGAKLNLYGQAVMVMNATTVSFNNNIGNGMHVDMTPGAIFGNTAGGIRSTFDNVDMSFNGANGLFFSSQFSSSAVQDAQSRTFFELNSVTGSSRISSNLSNGVLTQYTSGIHDILIQGDGVAVAPIVGGGNNIDTYTTAIQSNSVDGIHADIGNFANATITVEKVLIGGSTVAQGNGGDGIGFNVVANTFITVPAPDDNTDPIGNYQAQYNHAGIGTLNVNNSTIQNNAGNGISLLGNNLEGNGFDETEIKTRQVDSYGDGSGLINANLSNTNIVYNKLSGINIQVTGQMGGARGPGSGTAGPYNTFNIDNMNIANNGNYGIFFESNNAIRGHLNPLTFEHILYGFLSNDPDPIPENYPLQPQDAIGWPQFNAGYAAPVRYAFFMSNWMNLDTTSTSILNLTNSKVQGNGANHDFNNADGVKLRISTGSYLAANIDGNVLAGNGGNDLRVESFVQYNPLTGAAFLPSLAEHNAPPDLSAVEFDPSAQLDLRFVNNSGNTVNIVDPTINPYGSLPGSASGNGAVFPWDPQLDRFSTEAPGNARLTQLFMIEDANNLNTSNSFISGGQAQNLYQQFYNANFYMRPIDNWFDANFPRNYAQQPGNPFPNP